MTQCITMNNTPQITKHPNNEKYIKTQNEKVVGG